MPIPYNKTIKIEKYDTPTVDDTGGTINTLTSTVFSKARVRLLTAAERPVSGREGVVGSHRVYLPARTPIEENDVLWIDSKDYDIAVIDDPQGMGEFLQVDVIRRS